MWLHAAYARQPGHPGRIGYGLGYGLPPVEALHPGARAKGPTELPGEGGYTGCRGEQKQDEKPAPTPAPPPPPAPAGLGPTPPQPQVEPTPSPTPKLPGSMTPYLADNRPWSLVMVTASVGPYESVKVGSADFGAEGETLIQVRERIAKEIAAELD